MTGFEKAIDEAKAETMPFDSWERLPGEKSEAFAAFCVFRDFGLERNIRKAVESVEKDELIQGRRYRVWRNWASKFRWQERAADFDRYNEKLKQKGCGKQSRLRAKCTGQLQKKCLRLSARNLIL